MVFYSGVTRISQFELEKICCGFIVRGIEGENYVNQSGDLVLDFGSIGT